MLILRFIQLVSLITLQFKDMKKVVLFLAAAATLFSFPNASSAQAIAPPLGAAASFAMFTAVGAFDNVGPSVIKGDIGTNAGAFSGFPLGVVTGNIHIGDTYSTQAATDVQTAFMHMSTLPCVVPLSVLGGTGGNPQVLGPNTYCLGAATTLAGEVVLDGGGDPNALFFFQVGGALTTGALSKVTVTNGASLNNVYWQVTGRVDLGQNSVFRGTLIVDGAINMIEGATLLGRGLSRAGAITIDSNVITRAEVVTLPVTLASTTTISAYPNPVANSLTVTGVTQGSELTMMGITGKTIGHQLASTMGTNQVETSQLAPGLYLLKVSFADGSSSHLKVQKQ